MAQETKVQFQVVLILKPQKMLLDTALLNTEHYKIRIKGKWSNPMKGVAPPVHLGKVANEKRFFGVALEYGRPTYFYT